MSPAGLTRPLQSRPDTRRIFDEYPADLRTGPTVDDATKVLRVRRLSPDCADARPVSKVSCGMGLSMPHGRLLAARPGIARWLYLLAFLPILSTAMQPTPAEVVRNSVEGLRSAIKRDEVAIAQDSTRVIPLIRKHVIPHVDTEVFAKLILGQHWQSASESQRVAFTLAFAEALLRLYGVHVSEFTDAKISYLGAVPVGDNPNVVLVQTQVSSTNGPPRHVDYRMMRRNGEWKAIDASVDGISIVRTYRAALNEEIRRVGIGGAVQRLSR
jgi:phospholipid transport system substrate-binding protein